MSVSSDIYVIPLIRLTLDIIIAQDITMVVKNYNIQHDVNLLIYLAKNMVGNISHNPSINSPLKWSHIICLMLKMYAPIFLASLLKRVCPLWWDASLSREIIKIETNSLAPNVTITMINHIIICTNMIFSAVGCEDGLSKAADISLCLAGWMYK